MGQKSESRKTSVNQCRQLRGSGGTPPLKESEIWLFNKLNKTNLY